VVSADSAEGRQIAPVDRLRDLTPFAAAHTLSRQIAFPMVEVDFGGLWVRVEESPKHQELRLAHPVLSQANETDETERETDETERETERRQIALPTVEADFGGLWVRIEESPK
jgi:hypothetical protein